MANKKQISYRGGIITFSIPFNWKEEYAPEGGGTFYENKPDSGTLRLNIITMEIPADRIDDSQKEMLAAVTHVDSNSVEQLRNGNLLARTTTRTTESGTPITLFWWHLLNRADSGHARLANFSFTVPTAKERDRRTRKELDFIEHEVRESVFYRGIGVLAGNGA